MTMNIIIINLLNIRFLARQFLIKNMNEYVVRCHVKGYLLRDTIKYAALCSQQRTENSGRMRCGACFRYAEPSHRTVHERTDLTTNDTKYSPNIYTIFRTE